MATRGASTSQGYTLNNTTTTGTITTAATGSLLVVYTVSEGGSTAPTITDSYGNTWTATGSARRVSSTFNSWAHEFRCENASGGTGHTFTASKTGGNTSIFVVEYLGVETSGALDQNTGAADDTSSPITSGSVATTTADQVLVGFVGIEGSGVVSFTPNNSFTIVEEITSFSFWQGAVVERIVSSTGTYETSVGVTNLVSGAGLLSTFKADAPASGVVCAWLRA